LCVDYTKKIQREDFTQRRKDAENAENKKGFKLYSRFYAKMKIDLRGFPPSTHYVNIITNKV